MCLIALAVHAIPGQSLVVLANRDEFVARESAVADWWEDRPDTLGGRDLVAGGSWLAIRRDGRFAAVTNVRQGRPGSGEKSRGELVTSFLASDLSPAAYARELKDLAPAYAPFNLVFGHANELLVFHSPTRELNRLTRGVHGISNGRPDAPWPKTRRLSEHLTGLSRLPSQDTLFEWLSDTEEAGIHELPNTGVGTARERFLSPVCIQGADYATRASTVVAVDTRGRVSFCEQPWHAGRPLGRRPFTFTLESRP